MRRARTFLALMVWLSVVGNYRVHGAEPDSNPVFTNKTRFRIPFRYDAAEMDRLQAREVQLHVSSDHGAHWKLADKVDPRADHFDFVAPSDGEYWFAVRTLDAYNRFHPQGNNIEPGLKVVVDATSPVLELSLTELEPGKIELRWTAADDHLDATKLRLEYRQPDLPEWQQVAVVPQPNGQTTWVVPTGGVVAVRGSISDQAGNTANAEKELNVHPAAPPQPASDKSYHAPVAESQDGKIAGEAPTVPHANAASGLNPLASQKGNGKPEAADATARSDEDFLSDADGPRIQPRVKDRLVSDSPASRPVIVQKVQLPAQSPPDSPAAGAAPAVADEFTTPERVEPQPQPQSSVGGAHTVMVNKHDFQIGYRVDDVGPSGVGKVELFITQDGGQKWYRYGTDPDNQSPFPVTVPDDGMYGFELRVKNGAGIGDDPPRPGDKPSIVVTVDHTPPIAHLLPPQIGRGNSRNKILLRWTASDTNFGAAPILLEYAAQPTGPWTKIGDWQANSGRHVWTLQQGLPGKVYLRLTAKDAAGNVTESAAPEPLFIDFVRPAARIVDVEGKSAS